MILILKGAFPQKSINHAAKTFAALPPMPATVKRQGPYFSFTGAEQINVTTLYSFNNELTFDGNKKFIEKRLQEFSNVPGFTYSLEAWLNMEEAILAVNSSQRQA
ncbi:MAG: hypothetical protein KKG47_01950 [Proteobacteria bacterium]|nr:hypothetical protein [Pseudomonadota bacterium]MBU1737340.1 hypothetical protein [Pseudomonadota bacterium]